MDEDDIRYIALGSFDSHSLMLQFHDPVGGPPENALARVATSTLAHELVHLANTLGTAAGVREFLMTVEDHQLRLAILSRYLRDRGDAADFRLPILGDLTRSTVVNANVSTELALWARLQDVWRLYSGFERIPEPGAADAMGFWLDNNTTVRGRVVPWELAHANLLPFTGEATTLLPGYRQLTECQAKIIERIQRRISGEDGECSPAGLTRVDLQSFIRSTSSPYDPYYVALMAFCEARSRFAPHSAVGGYEEYVLVLADLAMMIDPVTTPKATATVFDVGLDTIETMKDGYTPFATYLRLCRLFWEQATSLPQLSEHERMTETVVRIQDALLAHIGPSITMKALTQELRATVDQYREMFVAHTIDNTPGIPDLFSKSFDAALRFREEKLAGGVFAEDLLTSRDKLEDFARFLSPTYAVGGLIVSLYEPHEGFGVGVDLANMQMFRDFLDALFFGNRPCPLAGDGRTPRTCALPAVPLCSALPYDIPEEGADAYCVREQTALLARPLGLHALKWSNARPA